jgi:hypothetical protein
MARYLIATDGSVRVACELCGEPHNLSDSAPLTRTTGVMRVPYDARAKSTRNPHCNSVSRIGVGGMKRFPLTRTVTFEFTCRRCRDQEGKPITPESTPARPTVFDPTPRLVKKGR